MKYDKRIKLIDNKENRRILFCKSFGALNSKGKYIIELDQDDKFITDNAFDIIYKQSEYFDLDMLHFNYISKRNLFKFSFKDKLKIIFNRIKSNNHKIEKQPNLKFSIFKSNSCTLWGNLIRTDLYKIVIYNLWPIIINYKIIFQEDFLITFFILIYAQNYKKIQNMLYLYFNNEESASSGHKNNSEYYLSVIFAGIIFYDYYIDYYSQDIHIIINYINFLKDDFKQAKILYPNLFYHFFGKIMTNNHLQKPNKIDIISDFNISDIYDKFIYLNRNINYNTNELFFTKKGFCRSEQIIKLSIIVISNNYKKLLKIINEINAQNIDHIELIIIYDDNKKENYNLLYNYSKYYFHIKLIDNKIKKGTVYSICKGVMNAKGKYLIILNPDIFFLKKDTFQKIYHILDKVDEDVIEFNLYKILSNNYLSLYKCKHFKSQFNLSKIKYNLEMNNIDIKNELLTNKLFKTDFFRKIIKQFKLVDYNEIIDYYHNNIFSFIIETTSYKFKYISSIDIYIKDNDLDKFKFNDFSSEQQKMINETILYIEFIFDHSKNSQEKKEKVLNEFFNVLSIIFNKFTRVSESSFKLFNKFMKCKYISQSNKDMLIFYYKSLIK